MGRFVILPDNTIISKAAKLIASEKIAGDYLEFGVYTGRSFVSAFHAIRRAFDEQSTFNIWNTQQDVVERRQLWRAMRFVAFDSFQGLPAPKRLDEQSRDFVQGKFASSRHQFEGNISGGGVPLERTIVVAGWFADTLTEATIRTHNLRHAAIVHIDSDLYESAKLALNFVAPLLVDGSVIIFDEWYAFRGNPCLGEQLAWREWCAVHPEWTATEYQKEGPWRNSFIVNKVGSPGETTHESSVASEDDQK